MNAALDLGQDFGVFDNSQTVTFQPSGGSPQSVAGVTAAALTEPELAVVAGTLGVDNRFRAFSLPVANLAGTVPGNGDLLIDSGGSTWIVQSVTLATLSSRYRALCIGQKG